MATSAKPTRPVLDGVAKRRAALAALAVLYAWKAERTVTHIDQFEIYAIGFLGLCLLVNVAWALAVVVFDVPRLRRPMRLLVVLIATCTLDVFTITQIVHWTSYDHTFGSGLLGFAGLGSSLPREASGVALDGNTRSRIDGSSSAYLKKGEGTLAKVSSEDELSLFYSKLLGSHLVNVLPETDVTFQSQHVTCLSSESPEVTIFFSIKGTPPWTVTYESYGFDGSHYVSELVISGTDAKESGKGKFVQDIPLWVQHPGTYRIISVAEAVDSNVIRAGSNFITIVPCPKVSISKPKASTEGCLHEKKTFELEAVGIPPFTVWYTDTVGSTHDVHTVQIDSGFEPVEKLPSSFVKSDDSEFVAKIEREIKRSVSYRAKKEISFELSQAGTYTVSVVGVQDGRNNTVIFANNVESDRFNPLNGVESGRLVSSQGPPPFSVHANDFPGARVKSCKDIYIRTGIKGGKEFFPIKLVGSPPFTVEYSIATKGENDALEISTHKAEFGNNEGNLVVDIAGKYRIEAVQDKYCKTRYGKLPNSKSPSASSLTNRTLILDKEKFIDSSGLMSSELTCDVFAAHPPTIKVRKSRSLEEECSTVGIELSLEFTGHPPFQVTYVVNHNKNRNGGQSQAFISDFNDPVGILYYEPPLDGEYQIELTGIKDKFYVMTPVSVQTSAFTIHPAPNAKVTAANRHICLGNNAEADLHLTGEGPWTVEYSIFYSSKGTDEKFTTVFEEPKATISIPTSKTVVGDITLQVLNVKDSKGCARNVNDQRVVFKVLSTLPYAQFELNRISFLYDTGFELPVQVTSATGHAEVSVLAPDGKVYTQGGVNSFSFRFSQPGDYKLVHVRDKYCATSIQDGDNILRAEVIPRPSFELDNVGNRLTDGESKSIKIRQPVCEGAEDYLKLAMTGKAPFTLRYTHELFMPGKDKSKEHKIFTEQSSSSIGRLRMKTTQSGKHVYKFLHIADQNYKSLEADTSVAVMGQKRGSRNADGSMVQVIQDVYMRPRARFDSERDIILQCISSGQDTRLHMELQGVAPFKVQITKWAAGKPAETEYLDIKTNDYFYKPGNVVELGKYRFRIVSVSDATGCETVYVGSEPDINAAVDITDMARIRFMDSEMGTLDEDTDTIIGNELSRSHTCEYDLISYQLEGTPPFQVTLVKGGKVYKIDANEQQLEIVTKSAGIVNVTQVCNHFGCCWEPRGGLVREVKPLPGILVNHGQDVVVDIREGGHSDMRVELIGKPPFEFQYTRTLFSWDGKLTAKPPATGEYREVNTTVYINNVTDHQYTVTATVDGLYRINYVRDAFCQTPNHRALFNQRAANAIIP